LPRFGKPQRHQLQIKKGWFIRHCSRATSSACLTQDGTLRHDARHETMRHEWHAAA
jgi:hypothetical protein